MKECKRYVQHDNFPFSPATDPSCAFGSVTQCTQRFQWGVAADVFSISTNKSRNSFWTDSHVPQFFIHQGVVDQFIAQLLTTWHELMQKVVPILQLTFVNLTTRRQPTLMVRFVATSWIRDDQFAPDSVSQLLHRSGVLLIIPVLFICQEQCTTKMHTPAGRLTRELVLAEHFKLDTSHCCTACLDSSLFQNIHFLIHQHALYRIHHDVLDQQFLHF